MNKCSRCSYLPNTEIKFFECGYCSQMEFEKRQKKKRNIINWIIAFFVALGILRTLYLIYYGFNFK